MARLQKKKDEKDLIYICANANMDALEFGMEYWKKKGKRKANTELYKLFQ